MYTLMLLECSDASGLNVLLGSFHRYVERSEVLYFDHGAADTSSPDWGSPPIRLRDGCAFVHGGDVFDKGVG